MVILVALLSLGVLLAGIAVFLVLRDVRGDDESLGPVDLRQPMTFQLVEEASPPPCASGTLPDGEGSSCLRLGTERMTVERVERIEAKPPSPETGTNGWSVQMRLTPSGGEEFGRLTGQAARRPESSDGRRIAVIVGGRVISAPVVTGPITGGEVMIQGSFSRREAQDLVRRMTGR